ncbi:hypothetical protein AVEN_141701-1 [Araneus ventricosus]|uniref:Uncharacterized protein n=1 Tax=Araneus ventricosus TaxID=182803 RepID=A0A4Y2JPJ3_ARAVE|nr:hypothetical protein AVEN_141701-1 [Araneus ventricosus]
METSEKNLDIGPNQAPLCSTTNRAQSTLLETAFWPTAWSNSLLARTGINFQDILHSKGDTSRSLRYRSRSESRSFKSPLTGPRLRESSGKSGSQP